MGLMYPFFGYFFLYLLHILKLVDYGGINYLYIKYFFLNTFISIIVAYVLWKIGVWAAGDAKLFIIYTWIIPFEYYSKGYILYFPSLALLLNIFIPIFIIISITAFLKNISITIGSLSKVFQKKVTILPLKGYWELARHKLKSSWKEILRESIGYLIVFFGFQILAGKIRLNPLLLIILFFAAYRLVSAGLKKIFYLFPAAIILLIYLASTAIHGRSVSGVALTFKTSIYYMFFVLILNAIFNIYIKYTQTKMMPIQALDSNVVLSDKTIQQFQQELKDFKDQIGIIYPDGLSYEQAELIKKIYIDKGYKCIEVYKTFPFAIWIFLGVILTVCLKQNVLNLFKDLLPKF